MPVNRKVDASVKRSITAGKNYNFAKMELFLSLGVEPVEGENASDLARELFKQANDLVNEQFKLLTDNPDGQDQKALEARVEVMEQKAPQNQPPTPPAVAALDILGYCQDPLCEVEGGKEIKNTPAAKKVWDNSEAKRYLHRCYNCAMADKAKRQG